MSQLGHEWEAEGQGGERVEKGQRDVMGLRSLSLAPRRSVKKRVRGPARSRRKNSRANFVPTFSLSFLSLLFFKKKVCRLSHRPARFSCAFFPLYRQQLVIVDACCGSHSEQQEGAKKQSRTKEMAAPPPGLPLGMAMPSAYAAPPPPPPPPPQQPLGMGLDAATALPTTDTIQAVRKKTVYDFIFFQWWSF